MLVILPFQPIVAVNVINSIRKVLADYYSNVTNGRIALYGISE